MQKVIFTDLDGTLLDKNYSFKKVRGGLRLLKKKKNIRKLISVLS